jgi:hypothetical protein
LREEAVIFGLATGFNYPIKVIIETLGCCFSRLRFLLFVPVFKHFCESLLREVINSHIFDGIDEG